MEKNLFMIMCHKNIKQVLRLAEKCVSDFSDVVIHADSKMPEEEYSFLEKEVSNMQQVFLAEKRFCGELDKESLVYIAMEMIQKGKKLQEENDVHYQYYCLLSGQDYLIKPIEYINRILFETYPKPYIDCNLWRKDMWMYHKFKWNSCMNFFRMKLDSKFKSKRHPIRILLLLAILIVNKVTCFILPSLYHKLKRSGVNLYGGSAWWILPDCVTEYICKEFNRSTQTVKLLLKAVTPEESFFQTMAMQSPFKDKIEINVREGQNCKTWAYFYDEEKPPRNHPYIFTVKEYNKLIKSTKWIARKFDSNIDSEIMDLLDEYYENAQ